jgi:hypothetical protein
VPVFIYDYGMSFRTLLITSCLVSAACSNSTANGTSVSFVGTWTAPISPQAGATDTLSLTFDASGGIKIVLSGTGTCNGSLTYSGLTYSATTDSLTLTGAATCSGAGVTCATGGTLGCGSTGPSATTCTYKMSGSNLTLTCPSPNDSFDATYTKS